MRPTNTSILRRRAAPAGQILRRLAFCELKRLLHGVGEVVLDGLALDAGTEEIGPQEFAERRRVLGKAAGAAQFAGERAVRVVDQLGHLLGNVLVSAAPSLVVERMHQA